MLPPQELPGAIRVRRIGAISRSSWRPRLPPYLRYLPLTSDKARHLAKLSVFFGIQRSRAGLVARKENPVVAQAFKKSLTLNSNFADNPPPFPPPCPPNCTA